MLSQQYVSLYLASPDRRFSVCCESPVVKKINMLCDVSVKRETGGILIGQYTHDLTTANILEASAPPADSLSSQFTFLRGVRGLRSILTKHWRQYNKAYYIGEWHYHPSCIVEPSETDVNTINMIALSERYKCKCPIMIIIGSRKNENSTRPIRAFVSLGTHIIELF